ncbi:PQQ-dependent sugar dehydrogenase [Methanospirillum hungatei]|jgi:glucose/arabinose dehydrogenase|uniref:PQQ-dependent sugar dehydrogenase n=1 Tax=Methanospirillum hungatei TaxID=2203 RepID=UPI0009D45377|nr:PQQ-dependent sugar dehydrogenase [Methanospirillum hungatei]OQA59644.1 MAG: hypothetical protein BWY45_00630 [Euryarchaeota archaeon ADurb.Bin294]HOW05155.1 PQQ-dependent sugar dehydrogenase [Methanospirillum hungatei]
MFSHIRERTFLVILLAGFVLLCILFFSQAVFQNPAGSGESNPFSGGAGTSATSSYDHIIRQLSVPPGFSVSIFATGIPGARSLAYSPDGTLFVGTRGDSVYAVRDTDKDGVAEMLIPVATGLHAPNGVALLDGDLYVAEIHRILKFPGIVTSLPTIPEPVIISTAFPSDPAHGWKFIRFGPDGMLYIPVGAPCNICLPPDDRYAALHRMRPDGSNREIFAHGIRNTVGFDWDPRTGDLWFTDNGRDMLGDDLPPDELNHAPEKGMFFGYPYRHGQDIADPEFGSVAPDNCVNCTPPAQDLGPHVASLGMRFYPGGMFPDRYAGSIFIAEHGSWNRRDPIGYRITEVTIQNGTATSYQPFIEGWLRDGKVYGRPVDVEILPDGSMLISDDMNGVIYLVRYTG